MEQTTKAAHLLNISAELRNQIYDHVAKDGRPTIMCNGIMVPRALARVCRQTRGEFLPLWEANVTKVKAKVKNFGLKALQASLETLRAKFAQDGRRISVHVDIFANSPGMCKVLAKSFVASAGYNTAFGIFRAFECRFAVRLDCSSLFDTEAIRVAQAFKTVFKLDDTSGIQIENCEDPVCKNFRRCIQAMSFPGRRCVWDDTR